MTKRGEVCAKGLGETTTKYGPVFDEEKNRKKLFVGCGCFSSQSPKGSGDPV